MKEPRFTEKYRNKHWRPCRFGVDLRNCGTQGRDTDGTLKNIFCALVTNRSAVTVPTQPFSGPDNPYLIYCERDNKICDASWKE